MVFEKSFFRFVERFPAFYLVSCLLAGSAYGAVYTWVGDTLVNDDWSEDSNWSTSSAPVTGSHTFNINTGSSEANPVVFDTGATTSFGSIGVSMLGNNSSDSGFLRINSGVLEFAAGQQYVGDSGIGHINIENGGTLRKLNGRLYLGNSAGGLGTITVNAGGSLISGTSNGGMIIGGAGDGILNLFGSSFLISDTSSGGDNRVDVGTSTGQGLIDIRDGIIDANSATVPQSLLIGADT